MIQKWDFMPIEKPVSRRNAEEKSSATSLKDGVAEKLQLSTP
jgi:hypothetical protein